MTCLSCIAAKRDGHWPHDGTHCRECHRTWTSFVEAHCVVCHLHFSTNNTADLHDSLCSDDAQATRRALASARRTAGTPIFAVRQRKHGEVFVQWSPDGAAERLATTRAAS